jgi:anti-sigma regulatory factor (Ser/Thr protein kinase)
MTELTGPRVLRLPRDPAAPASGRRFVRHLLDGADSSTVADVELMVSELVTNALVHTASEPRLEVTISRTLIRVAVYDTDPTAPALLQPDPTKAGGRGLMLVSVLASRWGTDPDEGGKVVWLEVDRTPHVR